MAVKLEVKDLAFAYDRQSIIENLSLQVNQGEFVSLIGPSGSGKSTLFYLIGGIYKPKRGEILLDGKPIHGKKGHIAYMPQQPSLFPWRTIEQNVRLAQELNGHVDPSHVQSLLKKSGLDHVAKRYPHELSGGMQQRAAFIRALASKQELLCLDEPFGALDALTRTHMQQWLLTVLETERRTILFITHSIEEALLLSDRIYVLSRQPMRVLREISVPYSRGDRFSLRGTADWMGLHREIENLLLPE